MTNDAISLQPATPADVALILACVRELAEYEHEPAAAQATPSQLHYALFGGHPAAEALIARWQGEPAGFALWFQTYSTWTGRPGLWLEDLYVRPAYRRRGIGRAVFGYLARLCRERDYGRLEWSVLDWNASALAFYAALGATPQSEWTTQRLTGAALARLADAAS